MPRSQAENFRAKAIECRSLASAETDPMLRSNLEWLETSFMNLADQADAHRDLRTSLQDPKKTSH